MQTTDRDFCKMSLYTYIIADFVEKSRRGEGAKASLEKGDSPRGGDMPAGQRGPLSTRGTSEAGGGILMKFFLGVKELRDNPSVKPAACQLL